MKPENVCGSEMDEDDEWLPQQLFEGVGFLVLEARTPHGATVKGRVEGPHCPPTIQKDNGHLCCQISEECRRAELVRRQMELLWRNGIPMCIETSLHPQCAHGMAEARSVHTVETGGSGDQNRLLLERWTIHVLPKRHVDKCELSVTPRFLLQAVRSYLHFSQLSAWLSSTKGQLPYPIAYRIYAPGDTSGDDFKERCDLHSFPQADVNHVTVRVTVESYPRVPTIPAISCPLQHTSQRETKHRVNVDSYRGRLDLTHNECKSTGYVDASNNNSNGLAASLPQGATSEACPFTSELPTAPVLSAKPKVKALDFKSSSKCKAPKLLTHTKRKESPKVLFTDNSAFSQPVYSKRFLDFDKADSEEAEKSNESWSRLKHSTCTQPSQTGFHPVNSTGELEAYLSTIADRNLWTDEQLKNIPVRKCKFFIGDDKPQEDKHVVKETPKLPVKSLCEQEDSLCKNLFQEFQGLDLEERIPQNAHRLKKGNDDNVFLCDYKTDNPTTTNPLNCEYKTGKPTNPLNCDSKPIQSNPSKSPESYRLRRRLTLPVELDQVKLNSETYNSVAKVRLDNDDCQKEICALSESATTLKTFSNGACSNGLQNGNTSNGLQNGNTSNGLQNGNTSNGLQNGACSNGVQNGKTSNGVVDKTKISQHKPVLKKNFSHLDSPTGKVPSYSEISGYHSAVGKSVSMVFNANTGLPSRSSPAPIKKKSSGKFDYDCSLMNTKAIKNAISCSRLTLRSEENSDGVNHQSIQTLSTSAPASTNSLLGNFEESVLNGRIEPIGVVEGFTAEIGASGAFCPKHITLPVTSYFFSLSDDNAPSPYLGHINLESNKRRGYHVPKAGTLQVTLFNPNKTVVKMFVVRYDLSDMPPNCQTFLRQRTLYTPVNRDPYSDDPQLPSFLRYLIHLRFFSSKSGKIYLHTDIRLIFARDKFEFDPRVANYELRSFTEAPHNPKFSPKR